MTRYGSIARNFLLSRIRKPLEDATLSLLTTITDAMIRSHARRARADKRGLLIVSSGGIGDTILFSLMIERFLGLTSKDENVILVVRSESRIVRFLFPARVKMMPVDYRKFIRNPIYRLSIAKDIRDLGVRLAISTDHLRLPTVDDVMIMASGATEKYALRPRSWPKHDAALMAHRAWYTDWVEPEPAMRHRLIRWWELAKELTKDDTPPPKVTFAPERLPAPVTGDRPHIVLHPFSAIPEREAAPDVFIEIVKVFGTTHDIILSTGPNDLARAPHHQALADMPEVTGDATDMESKAALMRGAALVVSVDTSVMHLAVGVGAPTLCLASAAHIVDSVPYDSRMTPENVRFEVPEIDCAGCLGNCIHPLEHGRYLCLQQLTPERVINAAREMLAAHGSGA